MRHHGWTAIAVLAVGLLLAPGQWAGAADKAADLANQLNARWGTPAYSAESVAQQRGAEKFGGWGGVLIGNLIAQEVAKSMLAAPNNTLTPEEALALATQDVMTARQDRGWGRVTQDLTGQKLGDLMKGAQAGTAASAGGQSASLGKGAKGSGKAAGAVAGKTEQEFSNSFSTPAQATGVVVSGPGASGGTGPGHEKGASGKDVADRGGSREAGGRSGSEGHGGGNGGGNGGGGGGGGGGGNGGGGGKGN